MSAIEGVVAYQRWSLRGVPLYIRREAKPRIKQQLVDGIKHFWATVTVEKCTRYVCHLRKVIPKVIELEGAATGF